MTIYDRSQAKRHINCSKIFSEDRVPMLALSNMVATCAMWLSQLKSKLIRIE